MKRYITSEDISVLPDTPGVYLFYGTLGELLYVGKSKTIRTRVRSHFASRQERSLCRKVFRIEIQETAGELGALLLESKMIKELRPMFNVASRQRRRLIVARRTVNAGGYYVVNLQPIDYFDVDVTEPVLGIFKHNTQAKEYLASIARSHRLCPKLLHLEIARGYCFSYHLGQCDGACMNEGDPAAYNERLERAFETRRVKAWPYDSAIAVRESSQDGKRSEVFLIDNWCLVAGFSTSTEGERRMVQAHHRFDYDSYKILFGFLNDPRSGLIVKPLDRGEYDQWLQSGPPTLSF